MIQPQDKENRREGTITEEKDDQHADFDLDILLEELISKKAH